MVINKYVIRVFGINTKGIHFYVKVLKQGDYTFADTPDEATQFYAIDSAQAHFKNIERWITGYYSNAGIEIIKHKTVTKIAHAW